MPMCHREHLCSDRFCVSMIDREQLDLFIRVIGEEIEKIDKEKSHVNIYTRSSSHARRDYAIGTVCELELKKQRLQSLYYAMVHAKDR